ncbi:MAG: DUF1351 domain-containing protein [Deltaproteobacteria bacterium]|jgi:hypothetical protein|nr:DUF1351 domain-containing protein [Deltaproteobacteria bacterium]
MTQQELLPALQFTPPVISLNFEELTARVREITERYTGLVVQEDDVTAIKSEMAGLNHLATQLADARKDAVARVSGPIKAFEEQVKGLEAEIKTTRTFLDEQVKAHIQRERDSRRASVQVTIDALKDEHGCKDLDIPIQEGWLNKTAKPTVISAEVQAIILTHKRQIEEAARLEQAKKDRVVALEGHCKTMEQGRGYVLPFSKFAHLQSLDLPLADALAKAGEIYAAEDAKIAEIEQRKLAATAPQPKPEPPKEAPHWTDAPEVPTVPAEARPLRKSMIITGTYNSENGPAIQALYRQIKLLCLSDTCTVKITELDHAQ